ncbi:hypothetical protein F4808DRAFT_468958 [Astrocystis sublimbata]|nr:hypothetical protein F4808DRAFT_468958 [Astrocystis sublimbata]
MSQYERKNLRGTQNCDIPKRKAIEHVSEGNIESLKYLIARLRGQNTPHDQAIWVSSATVKILPEKQRYYDLPSAKVTGSHQVLSHRPRPPFVNKECWLREIGPGLINAILKFKAGDHLELCELNAMLCMAIGGQSSNLGYGTSLGEMFGHHPDNTFDSSSVRGIRHRNAGILFFVGSRSEAKLGSATWHHYLMVIDVKKRTLYFVDPVASSRGLSEQQWEGIMSTNPGMLPPRKVFNLPLAQADSHVSSGIACIVNAYLLARRPSDLWKLKRSGRTDFKVPRIYIRTFMKSLERCLQLGVHPEWQPPSRPSNKKHNIPRISLDAPLVALALSVRKGNWVHLTQLAQGVFGRLPTALDNCPIPTQSSPHATIPSGESYYVAWTPRAGALLSGKDPPDRTDPRYWNKVVGPRIANMLLCKARGKRLSGYEINAYLHMVLVDFISGNRTPKVMNAKRDVDWECSVMESQPQFLVFRRGLGDGGHHWQAAEHIEAFALLQKEWAARISRIPAPNYLESGFLCMYHMLLLFRTPIRLEKLKHGDVVARVRDLDRVKVKDSTRKEVSAIRSTKAQPAQKHRAKKRRVSPTDEREDPPSSHTPVKLKLTCHSPRGTRPSSTPIKLKLKCPQPSSHHPTAPPKFHTKEYSKRGSTYHDILDRGGFSKAPVGPAERLARLRQGAVQTPFRRPGEF